MNDTNHEGTKQCSGCGLVKPLDQFNRRGSRLRGKCRACTSEEQKRYRENYPEKVAVSHRKYREANLDREREQDAERQRRIRASAPETHRERVQQQHLKYREAVFAHYGSSCACCGATEDLTVDHINGDGKSHRTEAKMASGTSTYRWLVKSGFPGGFQTLCDPCNRSKGTGDRCQLMHARHLIREGTDG